MKPGEILARYRASNEFHRLDYVLLDEFDQDYPLAIVLAFLIFRTFGGEIWLEATIEEIAEDAHLRVNPTRRALRLLRKQGYVVSRRVHPMEATLEFTIAEGYAATDPGATPATTPEATPDTDPPQPKLHPEKQPQLHLLPIRNKEQEEKQEQHNTRDTRVVYEGVIHTHEDVSFETFWECACRKEGKGAAKKAFLTACSKVDPSRLLEVWRVANSVWATWPKDRRQYIPHPTTWLNQERWGDDPPPPSASEFGPRPGESDEDYERRLLGQ